MLIVSGIKFLFPYAHSEGFSVVNLCECKMSLRIEATA